MPLARAAVRAALPGRVAVGLALLFCLLFLLEGLALLPYPGLQTDEVLFGSVIYEPRTLEGSVQVFQRKIPLMLMSYLGSLKALLYAGLFKVWPPSPWSVRVPVIVAGAAAVWLFFLLLRDTLGLRAALAGAALLATDTIYLLTTVFDWGPVALQHLLMLGGMVLLARFYVTAASGGRPRRLLLAAGFFLFGLGLWDKALFVWILAGLGAAALLVFPREVAKLLTPRHAAIALAAIALGALPLIIYNFRHHGPTFRNAQYSANDVRGKAAHLWRSLDGSSLFGYLSGEETGHRRKDPPDALERVSFAISDAAGRPRRNLAPLALVASLALLPFLWRSAAGRAVLFALIAALAAWLQMLFTRDAGGSTHHTVLLWPLPHLIIAAALAQASLWLRRAGAVLLALVLVLVCGSNLLVTNEYLAQFARHGGGDVWTDAVYPLQDRLLRTPARRVVVIDWGVIDVIRILGAGRLPLHQGITLAGKDALDEAERREVEVLVSSPEHVFVGHTPNHEVVTGSGARFDAHAREAGYRKEVLNVIRDRHGRPVFEIFRYAPEVRTGITSAQGPRL